MGSQAFPGAEVHTPVTRAVGSSKPPSSRQGDRGSDLDTPTAPSGRGVGGEVGADPSVRRSDATEQPGSLRLGEDAGDERMEEDASDTIPLAPVLLDPIPATLDTPQADRQPEVELPDAEDTGHTAGADAGVSDAAAIGELLDAYRRAVEAEDRSLLAAEIYGSTIPPEDLRFLDHWFSNGEDFVVSLRLSEVRILGDSAVAHVAQRMEYRLERTGEPRQLTVELILRFGRSIGGWRLEGLEPR